MSWDQAVAADDGDIELRFTGGPAGDLDNDPCAAEYETEVETDETRVVVTLYVVVLVDPPNVDCNEAGSDRTLIVDGLSVRELDERVLVDGRSGDPRQLSEP